MPSKEKEVVAAKTAATGLNNPAQGCLDRIPDADAPKVD
jgi:hypothetical protein